MIKINQPQLKIAKEFKELDKYDFSAYGDAEKSYHKLFDVTIENRDINFEDNHDEFLSFENKFIEVILDLSRKYLLLELIFPPVRTHRNMRTPGLYQFENNKEIEECVKDGIRENEYIQLLIPDLDLFFSSGHDFYWRFYTYKNKEINLGKINEIRDKFKLAGFKFE